MCPRRSKIDFIAKCLNTFFAYCSSSPTPRTDSSSVVFLKHTAAREVVERGMMGKEKGRIHLSTHLSLRCISPV